jgi:hypothetical protein
VPGGRLTAGVVSATALPRRDEQFIGFEEHVVEGEFLTGLDRAAADERERVPEPQVRVAGVVEEVPRVGALFLDAVEVVVPLHHGHTFALRLPHRVAVARVADDLFAVRVLAPDLDDLSPRDRLNSERPYPVDGGRTHGDLGAIPGVVRHGERRHRAILGGC